MPAATTYAPSGDAYIDGVLDSWKWAVRDFTFSFPASGSFYESNYGDNEPLYGFAGLNSAQKTTARAAFEQLSSVANLTFTEITESATQHADLRLASSSIPNTAWAYSPSMSPEGGDTWFSTGSGDFAAPVKGNYAFTSFLHEIGHALGLDHPHEGTVMPAGRDSMEYTLMSYNSYVGSADDGYMNETWGYSQSLMMYDIAALQHMYGANYSTQGGNTVYSWNAATGEMFINGKGRGAPGDNAVFLTVWDGGGTDTYDFSNYTTSVKVDLRPGEWTTTSASQLAKLHYDGSKIAVGNIANALLHNNDTRSLVENANGGSADDNITGNIQNNTLLGGHGNDWMKGGGGSDRLDGQAGWDTAAFDFSLTDAKLTYNDRAMVLENNGSFDHLFSIEQFQFLDRTIIQADNNAFVDDMYYYSQNDDVFHAFPDAEQHYAQHGWREGRDPNGFFDTSAYLETYADVAAAGINPLEHYALHGWKEGRDPSSLFDTTDYLQLNPDVAASGVNPLSHYLSNGIYEGRKIDSGIALVDDMFYFKNNKDVAAGRVDAEQHFQQYGWREGRDPNAFFDTSGYLTAYRDVAAAGINPLDHYLSYGGREGRDPSKNFDTAGYLQLNPDVAAAGVNALDHYLRNGIYEGRSSVDDGMFG